MLQLVMKNLAHMTCLICDISLKWTFKITVIRESVFDLMIIKDNVNWIYSVLIFLFDSVSDQISLALLYIRIQIQYGTLLCKISNMYRPF